MDMIDNWTLDGDGCVLCPDCTNESIDHWIEHLRPVRMIEPFDDDWCEECGISSRDFIY